MSLSTKVMEAMKTAMKAKDSQALESLRAVKSAILLAQTESGAKQELSEAERESINYSSHQNKKTPHIFNNVENCSYQSSGGAPNSKVRNPSPVPYKNDSRDKPSLYFLIYFQENQHHRSNDHQIGQNVKEVPDIT